jgi:hypothetical protein
MTKEFNTRLFAASLLGTIALGGGAAVACPSYQLAQGAVSYSGDQLMAPQSFVTQAGGDQSLDQCGLGVLGYGLFRSAPDFTFNLMQMGGREVEFSVNSGCDTALLINTADGEWHFNDDGNGNLDPLLRMSNLSQLEGQVDVWVGTFAGGGCQATLNVQAFGGAMPMPVPVPAPAPVPVPVPVPAAICPNPSMVGPSLTLAGSQLLSPQAFVAQVGGQHSVDNCPGIDGWGYANEAPSFTLYMSQMDAFQFSAEVNSDCDPTLILRDGFGQYHFNDDGPNGLQPRIEVGGASMNGRVDIWVGSFGGSACQGTITFATQQAFVPTPPPVAGGCPNPGLQGAPIYTTGSELYSPDTYSVMAGGAQDLSVCGLPVSGWGNFSAQPSYSFFLSGMQDYGRLEIQGTSSCDTVLLVRTADGSWYFDDDSNGNLNPMINLTNSFALNGRVDVWVGTYGGGTCPASIELETWYN